MDEAQEYIVKRADGTIERGLVWPSFLTDPPTWRNWPKEKDGSEIPAERCVMWPINSPMPEAARAMLEASQK